MVIFASPRFFERGRPRDLRGKAASMRMGESSKATVLQNELYTWICKTDFRVACLTSLTAFPWYLMALHPLFAESLRHKCLFAKPIGDIDFIKIRTQRAKRHAKRHLWRSDSA